MVSIIHKAPDTPPDPAFTIPFSVDAELGTIRKPTLMHLLIRDLGVPNSMEQVGEVFSLLQISH